MKISLTRKFLAGAFLATIATVPALDSASAASAAYCDRYAREQANYAAPPGSGALPGAVVGGVLGAIIGGVAGQGSRAVGAGAAIGAGVGGVSGAANRGRHWNNVYHAEYNNCMRGSRSNAGYGSAPPRWSDEWYDYCASRYRSFNPSTGKYLTNSGHYRYCQ
ncbi:MAG: BA14K family protein [Fimbriimonadaceae bacterium]|nr:BA14K family protein [Alphaproteobacteria bacterium]